MYEKCPVSDKKAFPTRKRAQTSLNYIKKKTKSSIDEKPIRAYRCTCGFWHLTSTKSEIENLKLKMKEK